LTRRLSDNTTAESQIHNIINNENELYEKFKNWLSYDIPQQPIKDLIEKSEWYSSILMFELNHIYQLWYDEEPSFELRNELGYYLKHNERKYYNRIKSFHLKTTLQK
jgi:hypothetical protein